MAQDPAFLFYSGDASLDVSHMNRLERGAYFDLIQSQKKFGKLTIEYIKKTLGKDFDLCWESLKMCLTYDNDMYFIQWLQDSIDKRKDYAKSRSNNRKGKNQSKNKDLSSTYVRHMENENENEIENEVVFGKSENLFFETSPGLVVHLEQFEREINNSTTKIEAAARKHKTTTEGIRQKIPDFIDTCRVKEMNRETWREYCNYFSNWLDKEFANQKKLKQTNGTHQLREMNYNEKP